MISRDEAFWAKVEPCPTSGCWLWTAGEMGRYGRFWNGTREVMAHRWAYERYVGPIPTGLQIDHLCRTPFCVNPDHMEPVTGRENILRGTSPSARAVRRGAVCLKGHPFEALDWRPNGRRVCRECQRQYRKSFAERNPGRPQEIAAKSRARRRIAGGESK